MAAPESLLHFPCRFPVKAMGLAEPDFEALVAEIVGRHVPDLSADAFSVRESRGGRWLAVTVVFEARSRDQLDAIYRDLTANERIVWAL